MCYSDESVKIKQTNIFTFTIIIYRDIDFSKTMFLILNITNQFFQIFTKNIFKQTNDGKKYLIIFKPFILYKNYYFLSQSLNFLSFYFNFFIFYKVYIMV